MKKLLALAILSFVSLTGCDNGSSNTPSGPVGPTEYVNTALENDVIEFLESRGVTGFTKIEPLHLLNDAYVDYQNFVEASGDYAPYYEARVSTSNIESQLVASFTEYAWVVPSSRSDQYGWEITDSAELVEIDVLYDDSEADFTGTWITVYSYADISGGGGDLTDGIDIGDDTTVVFADLGLENAEMYNYFTGTYIDIVFGEGEHDGTYYTSGSAIRIYGDGYVSIYSNASQNITKIVFTWDGSKKPNSDYEVDSGTYNTSNPTWTGNADSVTITRATGSGHWRLQSIAVTLG